MSGRGRPPVDRSRLYLAVEMLRNGASVGDVAIWTGIHRNTLYRYGISKRAVEALRDAFVIPVPPSDEHDSITESVHEIEKSVAASFRSAIARAHIPLIATTAAAQMESERLQVGVRAERLRNEARRLKQVASIGR